MPGHLFPKDYCNTTGINRNIHTKTPTESKQTHSLPLHSSLLSYFSVSFCQEPIEAKPSSHSYQDRLKTLWLYIEKIYFKDIG